MIRALFCSQSCDYMSYLPWASEYSQAETGNLHYIAVFWLSAALISFSHCLVRWHKINKRSEALRSRWALKYSDPIPWSGWISLYSEPYDEKAVAVVYYVFIRKDREASNLPLCYLTGYFENCVYFHIVFLPLAWFLEMESKLAKVILQCEKWNLFWGWQLPENLETWMVMQHFNYLKTKIFWRAALPSMNVTNLLKHSWWAHGRSKDVAVCVTKNGVDFLFLWGSTWGPLLVLNFMLINVNYHNF